MSNAPESSKPAEENQAPEETSGPVEDAVVLEEPELHDLKPAEDEAPADESEASSDDVAEASEEAPTEEPAPDNPAPVPARKSGGVAPFAGFVIGGIAAAAIGFGAARYVVPEGWPFPGTAPVEDPLPGLVAAQSDEIAALKAETAQLGATLAALQNDSSAADARQSLSERSDQLATALAAATARLDALDARLAAVEKLAPEGSAAADAAAKAYDRELAALREMFQGELAKIEAAQVDASTLEANATQAAQAATGQAALSRVMAALDTGQPYTDALSDLTTATGLTAPAALADHASEGVPTLANLQASFPEAARAALDAAIRAGVKDGSIGKVEAFLRIQLGTRTLEPKAGDDPDAVLSRAEDALRRGDLSGALSEIDALPEAAQPALATWKAQAESRKSAIEAGAALAQQLNSK